jgi:DNA-binding NtrC family response regulator
MITEMQLLLVDDEEDLIAMMKARLQRRGIAAWTASDGPAAIQLLAHHAIDVVVLDIKMPGMDGIEVLKHIRRHHPRIEVILLSGHGSVESAVEGLKLGACEYFLKPCSLSDLLHKAEEAFTRKRAAEEQARRSKIDEIISDPLALFDDEPD